MRLLVASVLLLWSYSNLAVSAAEDEINNSIDAKIVAESPDSSPTGNLNNSHHHQGPKLKVKEVLKKVKETFRQVSNLGRLNYRHRHKSSQDSSFSPDGTATVLWIVFGSIGGGMLLMGTYYLIRLHTEN